MFFVEGQFIANVKVMLDRVAHCVQTSVSNSRDLAVIAVVVNRRIRDNAVLLLEVAFVYGKYRFCIDVIVFENMVYPVRCKFFVRLVGHIFYKISHFLFHLFRKADAETLLQNIVDTALS